MSRSSPLDMRATGRGTLGRLLFNVNVAWFFISHRLEVARAARDIGFEVHVCGDITSAEEAALLRREGFTFHQVRLRRGGLSPGRDLAYLLGLLSTMRRIRPDFVHNVTVKPVVYGTLAAKLLGVPRIINAISGLGYAFSGARSRRLISNIVRLAYTVTLRRRGVVAIFQNDDDAGAFVGDGIIDREQVVLIRGSGVDITAFEPTPEPEGDPVVVLPARMLRDKGVVEFARAAEILRSKGYRAKYLLAGMIDKDNPAGLDQKEISDLERQTGVKWIGHVHDMAALYRKAHIVALPSYREGLPKALLEACAAGRPIVTTLVPGCRDAVRHGENGLLVEARDPAALAGALGALIEDSGLRRRMGAAGRRRAESEFDVKAVVSATLDVYRRMMAQEA